MRENTLDVKAIAEDTLALAFAYAFLINKTKINYEIHRI
jgi:hypothetical protein